MGEERNNFEKWWFSRYRFWPKRDSDGDYVILTTQEAWHACQARAKQTITLPVKDATGEH